MDITEVVGINSGEGSRDVALVQLDVLPSIWPRALEVMREHPRGLLDRHTEEYVWEMLLGRQWQLWVGVLDGEIELAGIGRVESYKNEEVYRILYVGGEFKQFLPGAVQVVEQFASFIGCDRLAFDTSRAVVRMLRKLNFGEHSVEMSKNVKVLWRESNGQ